MEVNITVVTLYFKLTKVGTMLVSWTCWDASRGADRAVILNLFSSVSIQYFYNFFSGKHTLMTTAATLLAYVIIHDDSYI